MTLQCSPHSKVRLCSPFIFPLVSCVICLSAYRTVLKICYRAMEEGDNRQNAFSKNKDALFYPREGCLDPKITNWSDQERKLFGEKIGKENFH